MKNILLDCDVILDLFLDREPHAKYTAYLLSQIDLQKLNGFTTAVIISNVYYILRQISSHEKVIKKINQFLTITDILTIDKQILLKAIQSKFKDFEDAIQYFACETNGQIDLIITRNTKDYKNSSIPVLTPEQYYKSAQ